MESKQSELIKSALENVKSMVDANTVTGTPITTDSGTVIIPVSKVFVGLATGGIDYFLRLSKAILAASCSARFLLEPVPSPITLSLRST